MIARLRSSLGNFGRALRDPVSWLIMLSTGLGYIGQWSWTVVVLIAVLLTLRSCVSDKYWFDEFREHGLLPALAWLWLGCLAQNMVFVGAAFALGWATRWLWGVPW